MLGFNPSCIKSVCLGIGPTDIFKSSPDGTSLVVQWLRCQVSNARGTDPTHSNPGLGTNIIPHAAQAIKGNKTNDPAQKKHRGCVQCVCVCIFKSSPGN